MKDIDEKNGGSYWDKKGKYQELHSKYYKKLVPGSGEATSSHGELLRMVNRLYYDVYNNGLCNDKTEEVDYILKNVNKFSQYAPSIQLGYILNILNEYVLINSTTCLDCHGTGEIEVEVSCNAGCDNGIHTCNCGGDENCSWCSGKGEYDCNECDGDGFTREMEDCGSCQDTTDEKLINSLSFDLLVDAIVLYVDSIETLVKEETYNVKKEKESMKTKLIELANKTASTNFMSYPDYDKECPMTTLPEALAFFVGEALSHDEDIDSAEVYDFLAQELSGTSIKEVAPERKDVSYWETMYFPSDEAIQNLMDKFDAGEKTPLGIFIGIANAETDFFPEADICKETIDKVIEHMTNSGLEEGPVVEAYHKAQSATMFSRLQKENPGAIIRFYVSEYDGDKTITWGMKKTEEEARKQFDEHIRDAGAQASDLHLYKALVEKTGYNDYKIIYDEVLSEHSVNFNK